MKVKKTVISHLKKNYALAPLTFHGEPHFLLASELAEPCLLFDRDGVQRDKVWDKPGGVMSMVQVPGAGGQFLTTHRFFSFNDASDACISIVTPRDRGGWEIRTLVDLPFVHRIDILEQGGVRYLIACALKSGHEYDDDWRFPGKVFAAVLPEDLSAFSAGHQLELTVLKDGLLKNHGYYRIQRDQGTQCVISAENGVFLFTPPQTGGGAWTIETLTGDPASDAVLVDFDGDGVEELGVIAPFHGDKVRIYKLLDGRYQMVYEYEKAMPFCHAFFGGMLCGRPRLVVGHRAGERALLAFAYDPAAGTYVPEVIDRGCGPANVLHFVRDGRDILAAANREIDEAALYELEP